jgi:hypothetical protein
MSMGDSTLLFPSESQTPRRLLILCLRVPSDDKSEH